MKGMRKHTFSLGSMLAHFADELGDGRPVASAAGIVELLDVVGGFCL